MKKLFLTLAFAALAMSLAINAGAQEKEKEMKTGWSFGVLPTATFSADNGF